MSGWREDSQHNGKMTPGKTFKEMRPWTLQQWRSIMLLSVPIKVLARTIPERLKDTVDKESDENKLAS
ncbi:hypothetical protein DPMN_041923 [Dreissena polymorpha]|uniref:Uncharacterized protein n=1 Tax=Dreissena polymorpha TaxID=45954 RepID=A0A9D4D039_DREPO|nr:hypothetical protein DPMN_041923 [Dreissena polymorpha]